MEGGIRRDWGWERLIYSLVLTDRTTVVEEGEGLKRLEVDGYRHVVLEGRLSNQGKSGLD